MKNDFLIKVNNGNTKTMCEIYSKLTIETPERHRCRHFGVFVVDFEQISYIVLVLTLNKKMPVASEFANFHCKRISAFGRSL